LNPLFEQRTSDLFIGMFDRTVADLKEKITALESSIAPTHYRMMLQGFLHGLDTGLMNVLVYLPESKPIKRKRLLILLQFFQDVLNDVKEHILGLGGADLPEAEFKRLTPLCHYMIAQLGRDPAPMIRDDPREANITLALCNYLLIGAATDNSAAQKWTKENRPRYARRLFSPSFDARLE
jgi:hypothetical protein